MYTEFERRSKTKSSLVIRRKEANDYWLLLLILPAAPKDKLHKNWKYHNQVYSEFWKKLELDHSNLLVCWSQLTKTIKKREDILRSCHFKRKRITPKIAFSNEATFHLNDQINFHDSFIYGFENSKATVTQSLKSPSITFWAMKTFKYDIVLSRFQRDC